MVKTLRVQESTYKMVMNFVGKLQSQKGERVTVDSALKELASKKTEKKDSHAWEKFEELVFAGPKTNSVEEVNVIQ